MNTVIITKEQRRQLQQLTHRVERMTQADGLFFERRPERQHRVRLASEAEIEEQRIIDGELSPIPCGFRAFVAVCSIGPGIRMRALVLGREGAETDLSEGQARAIFQRTTAGRFA
jgi:hypothetical protein